MTLSRFIIGWGMVKLGLGGVVTLLSLIIASVVANFSYQHGDVSLLSLGVAAMGALVMLSGWITIKWGEWLKGRGY